MNENEKKILKDEQQEQNEMRVSDEDMTSVVGGSESKEVKREITIPDPGEVLITRGHHLP